MNSYEKKSHKSPNTQREGNKNKRIENLFSELFYCRHNDLLNLQTMQNDVKIF